MPRQTILEVVALVEVVDEPGLLWLPRVALTREHARRGRVQAEDGPEEAEVLDGASGRDRLDGDTEVLADHLCDLAGGDAFLSHTVQHRTRRRLLEGQAEETCRIDAVHRGPAARTVAQEAGDALLTSDADDDRDEAVVALTVDRRREPNGRGAHAAIG